MDAIEFLKERGRMCKHHTKNGPCHVNGCPVYQLRVNLQGESGKKRTCSFVLGETPEEVVTIVENWSKANPKETRLEDFLEKYPGAIVNSRGVPKACCVDLGYCKTCPEIPCKMCWDDPFEGVEP